MPNIDAAELALLQARSGVITRELVWLQPRNIASGLIAPVGLWTGPDHAEFAIDGQVRVYFGAGAAISVAAVTSETGLAVRTLRAELTVLVPEVEDAIRAHDMRFAAAEVHRAVFNLETHALISPPRRIFKGWVDALSIATPQDGGSGGVDLQLVSVARAFTRSLPLTRSDAAQRLRNPSDAFRQYSATAGLRDVHWGEARPARRTDQ